MKKFGLALLVSVLLGVAACGREAEEAPPAPAATAPQVPVVHSERPWVAIGSATTVTANATATPAPADSIALGDGPGARYVFDQRVAAGETWRVTTYMWSQQPMQVRLYLSRECNSDRGEDFGQSDVVTIGPVPRAVEVSHAFSVDYSCVRVDLRSEGATGVVFATPPVLTQG